MKHVLLNAALALVTLAATIRPAAANPPRDISAEIAALRPSIVSARVFHAPDSANYRSALHEEDVAKGCFYPASGDGLTALLDVLAAGGLHEAEPSKYEFEVRTIVYLATRDGGTVPLLLDTRFPGMPSYGSYQRTVPIAADGAFSTALHDWMAPRTQINPETSGPCTGLIHLD